MLCITTAVLAKEDGVENRALNGFGTHLPNTYHFGYDSQAKDSPRLMREESRLPDGTVRGRYGYTDPFGVFRIVKYVSGNNGYYATEEIGEYPAPALTSTSTSTPHYFKATAPQVEDVVSSEEPDSYGRDFVAKFNPPLYHPEAHTMDTNGRQSAPNAPDDSPGKQFTPDNSHNIFSLSNSEEILEKKYRERKNLAKSLTQSHNRLNSGPKEPVIDKRVGQVLPTTTTTTTTRRPNRVPHLIGDNVSKELRREVNSSPIDDNNRSSIRFNVNHIVKSDDISRNRTQTSRQNSTHFELISNHRRRVGSERRFRDFAINTATSDDTTRRPDDTTTQQIPDRVSHLYYSPTRAPAVSFVTSVSREIHEEINETDSKSGSSDESERKTHEWYKSDDRFAVWTFTPEPTLPDTNATTDETIGLKVEDNVSSVSDKSPDVSAFLVRSGVQEFKTIPEDMTEEEMPKYLDRNYFFDLPKNMPTIKTTVDSNPIEYKPEINYKTFNNFFNRNSSPNKEESVGSDDTNEANIYEEVLTTEPTITETTPQSPQYESTQLVETELKTNGAQNTDNSSPDVTKSAFYHNLWSNLKNENNSAINDELMTTTLSPTTSTTSGNNYYKSYIFGEYNDHKSQTDHNSHVLRHFVHNLNKQSFNEKLVEESHDLSPSTETTTTFETTTETLVSGHKSDNNSLENKEINEKLLNTSFLTDFWHNLDVKSIMFSEGEPQNASLVSAPVVNTNTTTTTTTTTPITTTESPVVINENVSFITTTDSIETQTSFTTPTPVTTETISLEFLNNFWHNFNDNSDQYFIPLLDNKTVSEITNTTSDGLYETTASLADITPDEINDRPQEKTIDSNNNSLAAYERQDLDVLEDINYAIKVVPNVSANAPEVHKNQYIPPLQALFGLTQPVVKRVRKVQKHRLRQLISSADQSDRSIEESVPSTTTAAPEESADTYATITSTQTVSTISESQESPKSMANTDRVYRYIPPFPPSPPLIRDDNSDGSYDKMRANVGSNAEYSQTLNDMSEIVTTIQSMTKPIEKETIEVKESDFNDKTSVVFIERKDNMGSNEELKPTIELMAKSGHSRHQPNNDNSRPSNAVAADLTVCVVSIGPKTARTANQFVSQTGRVVLSVDTMRCHSRHTYRIECCDGVRQTALTGPVV
ncbi:unnamed protein product [Medioppia subpectinata]|uniref:Uncharacterized protein n=1 Tax=Medioppia subpectinata TaxID=1979941 RepID=A0A7R9Q0X5_9ACAR|nr:unnamed protein product [Medioppia subpectinata]CAG2108454.1 unnamed protein product [Medioppia subpectinata]